MGKIKITKYPWKSLQSYDTFQIKLSAGNRTGGILTRSSALYGRLVKEIQEFVFKELEEIRKRNTAQSVMCAPDGTAVTGRIRKRSQPKNL